MAYGRGRKAIARTDDNEAERHASAIKALEAVTPKKGDKVRSAQKQVAATGYFNQDNVKTFQTNVCTHLISKEHKEKKGRGGFFDRVPDLDGEIVEFMELCMNTGVVPTVSALCCWLGCSRDVFYNHVNNSQSPFHETCMNALNYCHMCLEMGASENKINSVSYIFQGKNYFGMKDQQEVTIANGNTQEVNSLETLDSLKEQIKKENKQCIDMQEAEYVEK